MKTPEEISKDIRDDYFRRYGSWVEGGMNEDTLDTLIVGAVSPLCQRIECLTVALRDTLTDMRYEIEQAYGEAEYASIRAILGD